MTATGDDGLIAHRYRLGGLLGTGGTASVFAAKDVVSGLSLALKILHPHLSRSEPDRHLFFAEARALERIQHPNVVGMLASGGRDGPAAAEQGAPAWIALTMATGTTLADLVDRHGALPVRDALAVADGVLQALTAVHAAGLVHRDVSPANIMVAGEEVVLLDFGLADAVGGSTQAVDTRHPPGQRHDFATDPTGVLGTANYLSPEQARGEAVDGRGDIYQLGGVLYFCLTGQPPFVGASTSAVLHAHARTPPPVPSVLARGIPRALDGIVVRALLKDRASRFQSAADMLAAIRTVDRTGSASRQPAPPLWSVGDARTAVLERQGVPAPFVEHSRSAPAGARRIPRSRRRLAGSGGLLAVVLVSATVAVGWYLAAAGPDQPVTVAELPADPTPIVDGPIVAPVVTGSLPAAVPELGTLTVQTATNALAAAGLQLGIVSVEDSAQPEGTVLASSPAAGTRMTAGGTVALTIASGANAVPPVRDLSRIEALAAVGAAGFNAETLFQNSESQPVGTALGSLPGEGAVHRLGEPVTVVISTGPGARAVPDPAPTATPTAEVTPTATPTATPSPTATQPPT